MPCRAVGDERIPTGRAPPFGDPVAFKDKVIDAVIAQMFAHCDARLPSANDNRINLLQDHALTLLCSVRVSSQASAAKVCSLAPAGKYGMTQQ